jgi:hypothetical protein
MKPSKPRVMVKLESTMTNMPCFCAWKNLVQGAGLREPQLTVDNAKLV